MGLYKNSKDASNTLVPIAGRGKAEYGASTVRTGTVTTTQTSFVAGDSGYIDFTFDTPMPDTDYVVEWVSDTSELSTTTAFTKTVNGGRLYFTVVGAVDHAISLTYKAFKLYTDTEYNGLLTKVGTATLNTTSKNLCGAVNELNGDIKHKSSIIRTGFDTNYFDELYLWYSEQGATVTVTGMVHATTAFDSWTGAEIVPQNTLPMTAGGSGNISGVALNTTNGGVAYVGTNNGTDLQLVKFDGVGWYRFSLSYVKESL